MKNFIKNIFSRIFKKHYPINSDVFHSDYFYLSTVTPFTEDELIDYALLTGKKMPEIERIMLYYSKNGIHSLWQINQLIKMGHYCG